MLLKKWGSRLRGNDGTTLSADKDVAPAQAGAPFSFKKLGSRLRGNDGVAISFAPAELTVRGERIACDPAYGAEPWDGALEQLKHLELGNARVTIELSGHFVRYALVPWSEALSTPAEEEVYVRHHFAKIHGERAKGWSVRASEAAPGAPRLASAVDAALIASLKDSFKKKTAKLVSIQPALMARFNAARGAVPAGGAWLVLAEADRACIALHGGHGWRAVQNARGEWRAALERERHRVEGDAPSLVLLAGAALPAQDASFSFKAL